MLRILSAWSHGIIDYAIVLLLIAGPAFTGFRGRQATYAYAIAFVLFVLTVMTRYPLGVRKSIPFPVHGAIEAIIAILLLVLPFLANFTAGVHSRNFYFALGLLLDEGLDAVFERHVRLGRAARAGVKAMGLDLFSPDEDRSAVVTAIRVPEAAEIIAGVRDRFGITLAGGQGDLKGKLVRIGHIGWFDVFDVATALAAIELVAAELGVDVERGVAVTAALEAYEHSTVA